MNKFDMLHEINTKLLIELDRVCRKHDVQYFMDSGTLLGAVRHKGAIPWDDDVDVAMTRENYNKFVRDCVPDLSEGYQFIRPSDYGKNHFYDYIPHLAYVNSRPMKPDEHTKFYKGLLNHVLLDIFILDDDTDSARGQKIHTIQTKLLYGLSWAYRESIDYSVYRPVEKIGVWVLAHLGKLTSQRHRAEAFHAHATKFNVKGYKTLYMANTIFPEMHLVYPKKWFESAVNLEYEGHEFMAPVGYKKILTRMYGDYMQLPPEEDRVPKHFDPNDPEFLCDLDGSFDPSRC